MKTQHPIPIGTLNETSLHADLKTWFAQPGDLIEVKVDGYVVDILHGESILEIQTANFSAIRRKLAKLTANRAVQLIHPIPLEKWIVKLDQDQSSIKSRRKSPKHGAVEDIFHELVSFPTLIVLENFCLRVCMIRSEEVRVKSEEWTWRTKGWKTVEQRLLEVESEHIFQTPKDLAALIPDTLPDVFTTADLSRTLDRPRRLAQQMAYCLRKLDLIEAVGRSGNAIRYRVPRKSTP